MTFYNTTNEEGENLKKYSEATKNQDMAILNIFRTRKGQHLSRYDVNDILLSQNVEMVITSVGRSINTLTKEGKLLKTKKKVKGIYGRDVYTWIYNDMQGLLVLAGENNDCVKPRKQEVTSEVIRSVLSELYEKIPSDDVLICKKCKTPTPKAWYRLDLTCMANKDCNGIVTTPIKYVKELILEKISEFAKE